MEPSSGAHKRRFNSHELRDPKVVEVGGEVAPDHHGLQVLLGASEEDFLTENLHLF